jgi:flagellar motor switch protein FliG
VTVTAPAALPAGPPAGTPAAGPGVAVVPARSRLALSGVQKAAVLLVHLGRERSAKIISRLGGPELDELTAEIVRLRSVPPEVVRDVVAEFHGMARSDQRLVTGGLSYAQTLLESSLGKDQASKVLGRVAEASVESPFMFLHKADPQQILSVLTGEHPQTIAVVLAHLKPEQSSLILSGLEREYQADIAHRIATMGRLDPDIVRNLEQVLYGRTSTVLAASSDEAVGGVDPLVEIINKADRSTERSILEGLDALDKQLAEEIRGRLFVFEDITGLEDRAVQLVLRQVDSNDLAKALKGVTEAVRDKVLANMSERASQNLVEEIELIGRVRLSEVEEAQAKVVQAIRALEESGQIVISRGGDDEFVA